jgi:hypothetical protein
MLDCASMHYLNVLFLFRCFFLLVESETATEINANTDRIYYIKEQGKRKPFDAFLILCFTNALSLHHICMRFNCRLPKLRVNLFWHALLLSTIYP